MTGNLKDRDNIKKTASFNVCKVRRNGVILLPAILAKTRLFYNKLQHRFLFSRW